MWPFGKKKEAVAPRCMIDLDALIHTAEAGLLDVRPDRYRDHRFFTVEGRQMVLSNIEELKLAYKDAFHELQTVKHADPEKLKQLWQVLTRDREGARQVFDRLNLAMARKLHDHYDRIIREHEE